jgi:hypothetical protein
MWDPGSDAKDMKVQETIKGKGKRGRGSNDK